MPELATLPPEFVSLTDRVQYVQRKNDNEYSSSCPECGGTLHEDGSYPDRFVMWRSNRQGNPFGMCLRGHCGFRWTPENESSWTEEERLEFTRKRIETEAAYNEQMETKIATLAAQIEQQKVYLRYHDQGMDNQAVVDYWDKRGIPEEWQRYLMLGCIADYKVTGKMSTYQSAAYTIPVWSEMERIENIKLRVESPKHDNDRYRNYYKSGCQHLYKPRHKTGGGGHAILVEGEIKAMVVTIRGGLDHEKYTVFGVQSKQPEYRLLKKLEAYDAVYIAFDPDAHQRTRYVDRATGEVKPGQIAVLEVAKQIGYDRARLVLPPRHGKFDDVILQGYNFSNAIRMAIKPERLII